MRTFVVAAAIVLTSAAAFADAPAPALATRADGRWQARSWPEAVATLPCWAFEKRTNGRWAMPGKVELPHNGIIRDVTFGPDESTRALEKRCGVAP